MAAEFRTLTVRRHARVGLVGDPAEAKEAWLVLHGYGMLARGILHWFKGAARADRLLVAPEALSRFYIDLKDAKRAVGASWTTREALADELEDQFEYIERVVGECVPDAIPLHVHGFSQGVSVGTRWATRTGRRVTRIVCWAGVIPDDVSPERVKAVLASEPLHLAVGSRDTRVPAERVEADAARFRAAGVDVTLHRFVGGHHIDGALLDSFGTPAGPGGMAR